MGVRIISCVASRIDVWHDNTDRCLKDAEDGENKEKLEQRDETYPCCSTEGFVRYGPAECFDDDGKIYQKQQGGREDGPDFNWLCRRVSFVKRKFVCCLVPR